MKTNIINLNKHIALKTLVEDVLSGWNPLFFKMKATIESPNTIIIDYKHHHEDNNIILATIIIDKRIKIIIDDNDNNLVLIDVLDGRRKLKRTIRRSIKKTFVHST